MIRLPAVLAILLAPLATAVVLAAAPAAAGWLASPDLVRLFAGEVVIGHATLPDGRVAGFREMFAPGGGLAGEGGPAGEPARWTWQGRWWTEDGQLCREVAALNSRTCLRIVMEEKSGYVAVVPSGKLGAPGSRAVADFTAIPAPLRDWRVPALVILSSAP